MAKRGRPTKYDPSMCADIPSMFENGESKVQVCVKLGISRATMALWEEQHPEFSEAIHEGLELSEAWWVNLAQNHLVIEHQGDRLDTGLWKSNMANRFGWREKSDVTSDGKPTIPNVTVEFVTPGAETDTDDKDEVR